jgi:hypothetical protein
MLVMGDEGTKLFCLIVGEINESEAKTQRRSFMSDLTG